MDLYTFCIHWQRDISELFEIEKNDKPRKRRERDFWKLV